MKIQTLSAIALAGLLAFGAAGATLAQTAARAQDPHHPTPEAGTQQPAGGDAPAQMAPGQMAPAPGGGMMQMMPPEMMTMMMRMMAQGGMMAGMGKPGAGGAAMPDMMAGQGLGPDVLYGMAERQPAEMTPDLARAWLQGQLDRHGNPRLALGEIAEAADGSITAEIRTIDGALVQKLAFNRYPGFVRQLD